MNNFVDPTICSWSESSFLLFSDNVWGNFIYYSHFFPFLTILLIALFVFFNRPKSPSSQALLFLAIIFTIWSLTDLVLWASERSDLIMFFWSILIYFDLLIYIGAFYLVYTFINDKFPSWKIDLLFLFSILPLVFFAHTPLNLTGFDFTNCWREALEGPLWQFYVYPLEVVISVAIVSYAIISVKSVSIQRRKEILFFTFGITLFLISFSIGNILGSFESNWEIAQYGLFGMPIFAALLTYLIIKYQTFNIKVLATEALVVGLGLLISSILFIRDIDNVRIITFITLILSIILGVLLIRSVRNEVFQKEELQKATKKLEKLNQQLLKHDKQKSEFVSIASHQLKTPVAAIRGYASMLLDGSYGEVPEKMKKPLEHIDQSAKFMATSVQDFLNVSRIESGNMEYNYSDFNLVEKVHHVVDSLRPEATKKGLLLIAKTLTDKSIVHADEGKVVQIIQNLLNNALKYTKKGSIRVSVDSDNKYIFVHITDTGIGFSEETRNNLFQKFSRAHNANSVNIEGTGLGLFVAQKMAQKMGGDITCQSKGEGLGATFTFSLPIKL